MVTSSLISSRTLISEKQMIFGHVGLFFDTLTKLKFYRSDHKPSEFWLIFPSSRHEQMSTPVSPFPVCECTEILKVLI